MRRFRFEWLAGQIPEEQRACGVYIDDGAEGCWTVTSPKPRTREQELVVFQAATKDFLKTAYYEHMTRCIGSLYVDGRCVVSRIFLYQPRR